MKRIVIAAPHSGSGKTTVTLGIMAALKRRGLAVAPFKVGPDFIDPGYHALVTGVPSINLDGWMCPPDFVQDSFARSTADADVAVIEGVMGLFDGIDGVSDAGSTAQVAKEIAAPVLLVVDARSQARSAAALVSGFAGFDPEVRVAAVVFNNVASANHERILREAMAAHLPDVTLLGCLPRDPDLAIPSRHLGLLTADENPLSESFIGHLVEVVERYLDLDALLDLAEVPDAAGCVAAPAAAVVSGEQPVRLAVAHDAAFCFAYPDNLRLLEESGAELCFFSPLSDASLPEDIGGIYLPGGYPELFAADLSANEPMRRAIRDAVEVGMPVYAECGGFIYLSQGMDSDDGECSFVGVFPVRTRMLPRRKALGYREIELIADGVIGAKGSAGRGHEFHYSEMEEVPVEFQRLYRVSRKGVELGYEGYRYKNCLASYIHLHFGSSPGIAREFVRHCRAHRTRSLT